MSCELNLNQREKKDIDTASCHRSRAPDGHAPVVIYRRARPATRSEEHTSELQSLMRISYAVFCFKTITLISTSYFLFLLSLFSFFILFTYIPLTLSFYF